MTDQKTNKIETMSFLENFLLPEEEYNKNAPLIFGGNKDGVHQMRMSEELLEAMKGRGTLMVTFVEPNTGKVIEVPVEDKDQFLEDLRNAEASGDMESFLKPLVEAHVKTEEQAFNEKDTVEIPAYKDPETEAPENPTAFTPPPFVTQIAELLFLSEVEKDMFYSLTEQYLKTVDHKTGSQLLSIAFQYLVSATSIAGVSLSHVKSPSNPGGLSSPFVRKKEDEIFDFDKFNPKDPVQTQFGVLTAKQFFLLKHIIDRFEFYAAQAMPIIVSSLEAAGIDIEKQNPLFLVKPAILDHLVLTVAAAMLVSPFAIEENFEKPRSQQQADGVARKIGAQASRKIVDLVHGVASTAKNIFWGKNRKSDAIPSFESLISEELEGK